MKNVLNRYLDDKIVVDTNSAWIYIGTLREVAEGWIALSDVDVHDSSETTTSKEVYVLDSKATGVKANRGLVYVNMNFIVSFSPLADVKYF